MINHLIYTIFFLIACNLQAKDLYLDLEGSLANKTSLTISYYDSAIFMDSKELLQGVTKTDVCDLTIYSNVRKSIEISISSPEGDGTNFHFIDSIIDREFPFLLFLKKENRTVGNNSKIYTNYKVTEPISEVLTLGIALSKQELSMVLAGDLAMQFTITLNHIG